MILTNVSQSGDEPALLSATPNKKGDFLLKKFFKVNGETTNQVEQSSQFVQPVSRPQAKDIHEVVKVHFNMIYS